MRNFNIFSPQSVSLLSLDAALQPSGHSIVTKTERKLLEEMPGAMAVYIALNQSLKEKCAAYLPFCRSQMGQDLLVLALSNPKSKGFFVEFGGCDGSTLSNTHMLEKQLGWNGIIAEPATVWHEKLQHNRTCHIDHRCVFSQSGLSLPFLETSGTNQNNSSPELSGLSAYAEGDWASNLRRQNSRQYNVTTVSLNDLLDEHNAPAEIDYISVDTEGSELAILEAFDFQKRTVKLFTIEHNYQEQQRQQIHELMSSHNYERVLPEITLWDDWYALRS